MYNVLVVDDQKSSRDLLRYIVAESSAYLQVGSLEDAGKSLDFCNNHKVDLILMDIHTAGKENGIVAAREIKKCHPAIKIIVVTFMVQQEHIDKAREIGCEGFWYKDHSEEALVEVMNSVMQGNIVYPDSPPVIQIGIAKTTDFTKQEMVVLKLKVNGLSHSEICEQLGITRSTLNYHIGNLKDKTGYANLLRLAIDVSMKKFIIADEDIMK